MAEKFLEKVADELIRNHESGFAHVYIVVPAKRARLFLRKHLAEKMRRTFLSPQYFIMPEWISFLSGKRTASELELIITLYDCYVNIAQDHDDFASFMQWASLVLKDFNDIDASLADATRVFSDLRDIREIEGWSFNSENLSSGQLQYLKFWSEMGALHSAFFEEQIARDQWSYHGLIKHILHDAKKYLDKIESAHIYFVGMAGFSTAEHLLLKELEKVSTLQVIWDLDHFYVNNLAHEAGIMARRSLANNHDTKWISNHLYTDEKHIEFRQCTTSVSQVLALCEQLQALSSEELNETCVVIPELTTLEVLLSSLSDIKVPVNIAAGISLVNTIPAKWLMLLIELHKKLNKGANGIYFKDLIQWLQLTSEVGWHKELLQIQMQKITNGSNVYFEVNDLSKWIDDNAEWSPVVGMLSNELSMETFLESVLEYFGGLEILSDFQKVAITKLSNVIRRIQQLLPKHYFLQNWDSIDSLLQVITSKESVYYEGEPATGLQILSMVETRALDFDRVFVLDSNEDFLPGTTIDQSYIPTDLRQHYKLPMPQEKEGMFAYTFYRLLHRASHVQLYYSSISSDFRGTEQSRYITQIESELPAYNERISIERRSMKLSISNRGKQEITNSDFAKRRLDALFEHGISPSAINKFNKCPLDFYYRYIIGLGEEEEPEEQIGVATFGSIVHYILEEFYGTYIGTFPELKDYDNFENALEDLLRKAMQNHFKIHQIDLGHNRLAYSVALAMLKRIINYERQLLAKRKGDGLVSRVEKIEFTLEREIETSKFDWAKPVKLRGKGDRLDSVSGIHYILDYKTGRVLQKDIEMKGNVEELFLDDNSSKQLQLLSYIYMFIGQGYNLENVRAGFYSFINHSQGYMILNGKDESIIDFETIQSFEVGFMNWVKRLYELESFCHNEESKHCEYCR
jgi:ATP-dependent helicase/nuclease subunit B